MSEPEREQTGDREDGTCGKESVVEWHYGECPQRLARVRRHALADPVWRKDDDE